METRPGMSGADSSKRYGLLSVGFGLREAAIAPSVCPEHGRSSVCQQAVRANRRRPPRNSNQSTGFRAVGILGQKVENLNDH